MGRKDIDLLRERVIKAIGYAKEEGELLYVEVVGVLTLILSDILDMAREEANDSEWEGNDDD